MPNRQARIVALAFTTLTVAACGGSSSTSSAPASQTRTVGAAGATLTAGAAKLSIPPGALQNDTQITLRETEPHGAGRRLRIEVEPPGHALAVPAQLAFDDGGANTKVRVVDDQGGLREVEIEDRNHHRAKTNLSTLDAVEVEDEHGAACATACGANEECDDGTCKPHAEDEHARTCDPVCASGQECDDGACKAHAEFEVEHGGVPGTCTPACATGLECDNGTCKPHGGSHGMP